MNRWPRGASSGNGEPSPTLSDLTAKPGLLPTGTRARRIALVAGETSGDALGAGLIGELRKRFPEAEFAGIGGKAMRDAGCNTWYDAGELAVMGLSEVLRHLPRLLRLRRHFRARVLEWKPDVFIGIDAPDFNLGVERWLKQRDVRTVHYVSPSVWAWREKRAQKIGASADLVLCLFPMEPPIYARHGIDARFVGHPMADEMPMEPDQAAARHALGLHIHTPVLAVLPGSRLVRSGGWEGYSSKRRSLSRSRAPLQIVVPAANPDCRVALQSLVSEAGFTTPPRLLDGQAREAMVAADVVLLASGTATLEAMLAKRAMVVGYKVAPLTYRIVKAFGMLKVERYALPNVLAGSDLEPELMQDECTPGNLAAAVLNQFQHPEATGALQPAIASCTRPCASTLRRVPPTPSRTCCDTAGFPREPAFA